MTKSSKLMISIITTSMFLGGCGGDDKSSTKKDTPAKLQEASVETPAQKAEEKAKVESPATKTPAPSVATPVAAKTPAPVNSTPAEAVVVPPKDPSQLATINVRGGMGLNFDSTRAVVVSSAAVNIVDVTSNPKNPTIRGTINPKSSIYYAEISRDNKKAFLSTQAGFLTYDISNVASPVLLHTYNVNIAPRATALSTDGTRLYVFENAGKLETFDISNTQDPVPLSKIELGLSGYSNRYGVYPSSDNKKLFVIDQNYGLVIVDISEPDLPVVEGKIVFNNGYYNDLAFSSDEKTLYLASNNFGLRIINISDTKNPVLISNLKSRGAYGVAASNDGTKVYLATYGQGLQVVDVSDKSKPIVKYIYKSGSYIASSSVRLSKDGKTAYASNGSTLQTIDLGKYASQ